MAFDEIGGKIGGKTAIPHIKKDESHPLRHYLFLTYVTSVIYPKNHPKSYKLHILISQHYQRLIKSIQVVNGGIYDKLVANWWQSPKDFFCPAI